MTSPLKHMFECCKNKCGGHTQKLCFFLLILFLFYTCTRREVRDHEFDYFIFSQRWLPTSCIEYVEKGNRSHDSHVCVLPKNFKLWSIHGLWPTQNKSIGPFYCNRSMPFDIHKIETMEPDLEQFWPNIEGGKSIESLWQHEWEKHGTCAAQLQSLNSEIKYFSTALSIYRKYNIQAVFTKNKIFPNTSKTTVSDLFYIIKSAFGKVPQIHCFHEVRSNRAYLSEIRLCYNKKLELIDCGNIHSCNWGFKGLTNCPQNQELVYSDTATPPPALRPPSRNPAYFNYEMLYNTLLFIRFLQWVF